MAKKKQKTIKEMMLEKQIRSNVQKEITANGTKNGQNIVIEKQSNFSSILKLLLELIKSLFKIALIIIVIILASIGRNCFD